jgi:hypothetical protein
MTGKYSEIKYEVMQMNSFFWLFTGGALIASLVVASAMIHGTPFVFGLTAFVMFLELLITITFGVAAGIKLARGD